MRQLLLLLNEIQEKEWFPILKWLENEIGVKLKTTTGISPISQDEEEIYKLKDYIISCEPPFLTALYLSSQALGSVVLGCALCEKHINVNQAFKLAFIDEEYQESYWGKDEEAMQKREGLKEELNSIAYYLELLEE